MVGVVGQPSSAPSGEWPVALAAAPRAALGAELTGCSFRYAAEEQLKQVGALHAAAPAAAAAAAAAATRGGGAPHPELSSAASQMAGPSLRVGISQRS
jgi:hypothetical protein